MQTQVPAAPPRTFIPTVSERATPLLDRIGPVTDERVVIVGSHALDLMCTLIGRGAAEVTMLSRGERPRAQCADLVILTGIADPEDAGAGIALAKRALACAGRILLATAPDPLRLIAAATRQPLRAAGFSAVLGHRSGAISVVTAELPLFGRLPSA